MKSFRLAMLFVLLFAVMGIAFAQDSAESEIPADLSGIMLQTAASGTFLENTDGTYLLTLEDVPAVTRYQLHVPDLSAGRIATRLVALFWTSAEELTSTAVLELDGLTLELTLSAPSYDPATNSISYTAVVDDMYFTGEEAEEAKDDPTVPEEFVDASLFIVLNQAFVTGFNAGREEAGLRGPTTGKNCSLCNSLPTDDLFIR